MKRPPEPLTRDEARRLLNAPNPRYPSGRRNRALLALLYHGGLRCSEALGLELRDIDFKRCSVHVRSGKCERDRIVAVGAECCERVKAWLEVYPGGPLIICTRSRKPVGTRYVRDLVARMGRRAKIAKRCHPHGLRHTHASELAELRMSLPNIADQLGHQSVATTDRYIRRIAPHERVATLNAARERFHAGQSEAGDVLPW